MKQKSLVWRRSFTTQLDFNTEWWNQYFTRSSPPSRLPLQESQKKGQLPFGVLIQIIKLEEIKQATLLFHTFPSSSGVEVNFFSKLVLDTLHHGRQITGFNFHSENSLRVI